MNIIVKQNKPDAYIDQWLTCTCTEDEKYNMNFVAKKNENNGLNEIEMEDFEKNQMKNNKKQAMWRHKDNMW